MFFFKKKKSERQDNLEQPRPVTKKLNTTKVLKAETDPKFSVVCEITYMESDEVII